MIIKRVFATPAPEVALASRACSALAVALLGLTVIVPTASALAPGEDGVIVTVPVSGIGDVAQAVALDPNGNIVLAGTDGGNHSVLVRLTPSGALDLSFGNNGIAINDLSVNSGDALRALVRLDDGRYLGCGSFNNIIAGTGFDFVVARFNSTGSLDGSFAGGYAVTAFAPGSAPDQCNALAVQTDGMVVAAGVTTVAGHPHVALARYTTSGVLDTNFGTGGLVDISAASNGGDSEARAVQLQPDGKLLIGGYAFGPGSSEFLVMRLNGIDGSLDPSFGTGGITRTPVGTSEDIANAMVRQPDGRIVLAGSAIAADGRRNFALARYTSAGVLDPGFGTGGLVTTPVGPSDDIAYSLILMPWGRLVAAGSARINTSSAETDLAVVAYNADGSLDRFFGVGGKRMVDISAFADVVYGLATDLSGARFWAVGTAYGTQTTAQDFLAVEFGLPDTIFRHGFETSTAP
jgi:uncharacterized delta-60 repeat protein